jgi:hypothetical protein
MPSRSTTAARTNQMNVLSKYRRSPASVPAALIPIHRLYGRAATLLENDCLRNNPLHIRNTPCHDISPTNIRIITCSCPRSSDLVASRLQHRSRVAPRVGEQRKPSVVVYYATVRSLAGSLAAHNSLSSKVESNANLAWLCLSAYRRSGSAALWSDTQ